MSRIGKQPITVPANVTVTIENNLVTVKGPKGELSRQINKDMKLTLENGVLTVERPSDEKTHRSMHGLSPYSDQQHGCRCNHRFQQIFRNCRCRLSCR